MITLFHAIQSLVPGAEISVGLYDQNITWHQPEIAPVTLEQILEEQQRLQQAYDWDEYKRNRAREYPTIQEQLDALYHAGLFPPEMTGRIRAVKAKYPRYSPNQTQTAEQTTPTMSVEQWLAQEANKMTHDQWLAQQQRSTAPMTREEWLASQAAINTPNNAGSVSEVARTMTTEEWLAEQTKMTADQWLAQQQQSAAPMTREEWLASQVEVRTVHSATPTNLVTVTRTMTTEEWLKEQTSAVNSQTMTREQWLEQQKQQDQPRKLTREEWLAEQLKIGN